MSIVILLQAAVFYIFKDDFQNALRKTKCFSFVDLLYLAAEIDKHGLQNVLLPIFLLSLCTLNFPFLSLPLSLSFLFLCQAMFQIYIKDTSSVGI